ncbi:Fms-interacting protein-domain-containing protein [Xylariomycetidae sp. FL2044]|nr:Fms-interacting protein-domain-containing protein [Xylariomycetidae sp. FL2044]
MTRHRHQHQTPIPPLGITNINLIHSVFFETFSSPHSLPRHLLHLNWHPSILLTMATDEIVTDPKLAIVLNTSRETRLQALSLVDQIAAAGALDIASSDVQLEISKQQKLLITNLAQLRGLHRAAHFSARQTKSQTSEARQEVDHLHLQLQNLFYEQRYLQGEIAACDEYDHTYKHLPLISEEEFLDLKPEHANSDENMLMTARIEHERSEREALEQKRMELLKRKQKLIADNKKRKDDLANLDKELEKFIDAAKPIQKLFDKNV